MALAGQRSVQTVDGVTDVLPLRYSDSVGADLDAQWPVGNLLSIGVQLCWCWVAGTSHLLCSFP